MVKKKIVLYVYIVYIKTDDICKDIAENIFKKSLML